MKWKAVHLEEAATEPEAEDETEAATGPETGIKTIRSVYGKKEYRIYEYHSAGFSR